MRRLLEAVLNALYPGKEPLRIDGLTYAGAALVLLTVALLVVI